MKKFVLAVFAAILFTTGAMAQCVDGWADVLYVTHVGEVYAVVDYDCNGIADEKGGTVWGEKGGPSTEFTSLVESDGMLFAGSDSTLWVMPDDDRNSYREQEHNIVFPGLRTPEAMIPKGDRIWLGGRGPIVEARLDIRDEEGELKPKEEQGIHIVPADQYQIRLGPQNCRAFAWHYNTGSLLCLGETYGHDPEPGLWVVPNTFSGLDWKNSQFMLLPNRFSWSPVGLAADSTGIYLMETMSGMEGQVVPALISKLTLRRSGFAPFAMSSYNVIHEAKTDLSLSQRLVAGKSGVYALTTRELGHENVVYDIVRIDKNSRATIFLPNLLYRPTAISVRPPIVP